MAAKEQPIPATPRLQSVAAAYSQATKALRDAERALASADAAALAAKEAWTRADQAKRLAERRLLETAGA